MHYGPTFIALDTLNWNHWTCHCSCP